MKIFRASSFIEAFKYYIHIIKGKEKLSLHLPVLYININNLNRLLYIKILSYRIFYILRDFCNISWQQLNLISKDIYIFFLHLFNQLFVVSFYTMRKKNMEKEKLARAKINGLLHNIKWYQYIGVGTRKSWLKIIWNKNFYTYTAAL